MSAPCTPQADALSKKFQTLSTAERERERKRARLAADKAYDAKVAASPPQQWEEDKVRDFLLYSGRVKHGGSNDSLEESIFLDELCAHSYILRPPDTEKYEAIFEQFNIKRVFFQRRIRRADGNIVAVYDNYLQGVDLAADVPEESEESQSQSPGGHFWGEHCLSGLPEDVKWFKETFPKKTESLQDDFTVPKWYRPLMEGFGVYSTQQGKEGEKVDKCSYCGLTKMGDRNYTILLNPGGRSYKTSLIELLGKEQHAINISSNVVVKGQDAIMFMLSKKLGEMEMEMLYDCQYSNPPATHVIEDRPAPGQPIVGATYLDTRFEDKPALQERGALWDRQLGKWYVPRGKDLSAFARWNPSALSNSSDEQRQQRQQRGQRRRSVIQSDSESEEDGDGAEGADEDDDDDLLTPAARGRFERKMAMTVNSFVSTDGVTPTQLYYSRRNSRLWKWQEHGCLITIDVARGDKMLHESSFWVMLENLLSSKISTDKYTGYEFEFVKRGFHPDAHVPRILLSTNGITEQDNDGFERSYAVPKKFLDAYTSPIGHDRPIVLFLNNVTLDLSVHLASHEFLDNMGSELTALNQRTAYENDERLESMKMGLGSGVPTGQRPPETSMRCVYYSAMQTHFLRSGNDVASGFWTSDLSKIFEPGLMNESAGFMYDPLMHSLFRHFTPFEQFRAGSQGEEEEMRDKLRGALGTSEMPFELTVIDFDKLHDTVNKAHYYQQLHEVGNTLNTSSEAWRNGPLRNKGAKAWITRINKCIEMFLDGLLRGIDEMDGVKTSIFDTSRYGGPGSVGGGKQGLRWAKVNSLIVADNELCNKQAALSVSFFFFRSIVTRLPKAVDDEFTEQAKAEVKNACVRLRDWGKWAWKM